MRKDFGATLKRYRRNSADPDRGGRLTQARLAELVSQGAGRKVSTAQISYWETGARPFPLDDRPLLLALVEVMAEYGGVRSEEDANQLFRSLRLAGLSPAERKRLAPYWTPTPNSVADLQPTRERTTETAKSDRWDDRLIDLINREVTWDRLFTLLLLISAFVVCQTLLTPALHWPLADGAGLRSAALGYAGAALLTPTLIAFSATLPGAAKSDHRALLPRLAGSVVGFNAAAVMLLLLPLIDLHLVELGGWVFVASLAWPIFLGWFGARQVARSRQSTADTAMVARTELLFLLVFALFGVAIAWALPTIYSFSQEIGLLRAGYVAIVGFAYWHREKGRPLEQQSPWRVWLMCGVLLPLCAIGLALYGSLGDVLLLSPADAFSAIAASLYIVALVSVLCAVLIWHPPTVTLKGLAFWLALFVLPFLAIARLQIGDAMQRALLAIVAVIWLAWGRRRLPADWSFHPALVTTIVAAFAALVVTTQTAMPPAVPLILYLLLNAWLIHRLSHKQKPVDAHT